MCTYSRIPFHRGWIPKIVIYEGNVVYLVTLNLIKKAKCRETKVTCPYSINYNILCTCTSLKRCVWITLKTGVNLLKKYQDAKLFKFLVYFASINLLFNSVYVYFGNMCINVF